VAIAIDMDAKRPERTWRHLMIRRGNDFAALDAATFKQRQEEVFLMGRAITRQIMHENVLRRHQRMRTQDRTEAPEQVEV
jgi:hypothetical protein